MFILNAQKKKATLQKVYKKGCSCVGFSSSMTISLNKVFGMVIGPSTITFKGALDAENNPIEKPCQCLSLITKWRTFDFYVENKDDIVNLHMALESEILGIHHVTQKRIVRFKFLRQRFEFEANRQHITMKNLLMNMVYEAV